MSFDAGQITGYDETATVGNGTYAGCQTVGCHNQSLPYSAAWDIAPGTLACDSCHSDTDPGTGDHTAHIGAGKACTDCHADVAASDTDDLAHISAKPSLAEVSNGVDGTEVAAVAFVDDDFGYTAPNCLYAR